ncbi:MAG: hypothetical protein JNN27_03360 [Planctomycetes bacterium]|nr:hypothetical protein [Planctomycetota bacterium]
MIALRLALAAVLAASASATSTYVVDDTPGPGVDFNSISAAIAFATPGDVLVVRPGNYLAFMLDKELTIVGASGVSIGPGSRILNVTAPDGVRLAGLRFWNLEIAGCAGPVLCDQLNIDGFSGDPSLMVSSSSDVRFQRSTIRGGNGTLGGDGRRGAIVDASRVEFTSCTLRGGNGADHGPSTDGGYGASALVCRNGARVHMANTSAFGGDGGDACAALCVGIDGNGGDAVVLQSASTLVIAGAPGIELRGGLAGQAWGGASDGWGLRASNSFVRWSGVSIKRGDGFSPGLTVSSTPVQVPAQPDPTLELIGTTSVGQSWQFVLHGAPGRNARLQQGNRARVLADALSVIEQLNNRIRLHPLGAISGAGTASMSASVGSTTAPGWTRIYQGMQIDPLTGGIDERTNSVFVIVR